MALASTAQVLFLFWCSYSAGLSSAGTLQQSPKTDDVDMTQNLTPNDVRCDVPGCEYDLQLYCLSDGVIVMGSCSLKKTLCKNGKRNSLELANSWDSCFLATYTIIYPHQSPTDAAGRPEFGQETEVGQETKDGGPQDRDATQLLNLQLEQDLLTDPEMDQEVKGKVIRGEGGEVKIHGGNNGD